MTAFDHRRRTGFSRRTVLGAGGATLAAALVPARLWAADTAASIPLDDLDVFGPPVGPYERIRALFQVPEDVETLVKRLWGAYMDGGRPDYGHWALSYNYLWWQTLPQQVDVRVRVARIGQKMSAKYDADHPAKPEGVYWSAVFLGLEALTKGVLNSLQMVPEFIARLDASIARDASYLHNAAEWAKAKMYFKRPPFPMSVGSMRKGYEILEKADPADERAYALYAVLRAEAAYMADGRAAAARELKRLDDVCPRDMITRYTYELSAYLGERLLAAADAGTYDKYTWDPLLEPVLALRDRAFQPKQICK